MPAAPEDGSSAAGDAARLREVVSRLNDYIQNINRNIEFTVNAEANRVIVRVCNLETAEVLREIPAQEALTLPRYLSGQQEWMRRLGL